MNPAKGKPRIAIMGEFSAGKSTLSNLLLGHRLLPEKVTATRLPPVWITAGTGDPVQVSTDLSESPISMEALDGISLDDTLYVRMQAEADILDHCDLIDFPGISDPNMAAEVWERMLPHVDAVMWCTHATQAWRQSEAAAWDLVPDAVRANSLLLVTRFDKLTADRDKRRVLKRLEHETAGLFSAICPIALTKAIAAREAPVDWHASGAKDLFDHLQAIADRTRRGADVASIAPARDAAQAEALAPQADPETAADTVTPVVTTAPEAGVAAPEAAEAVPELAPIVIPEIPDVPSVTAAEAVTASEAQSETDAKENVPSEARPAAAEAPADSLAEPDPVAASPAPIVIPEVPDPVPAAANAPDARPAPAEDRSDAPQLAAVDTPPSEPSTMAPLQLTSAERVDGSARIVPRRVRPVGGARTRRPGRSSANVLRDPLLERS